MPSRRMLLALSTVALMWGLLGGISARGAAAPLPRSMASAGDSITRGFDVGWSCVLRDCTQDSWSTGNDCAGVDSQYCRLLAGGDQAIRGNNRNDAVTGARMADLAGQLIAAGRDQHVDYLTVEIGANDLCTSNIPSMTSLSTFEAQFSAALSGFFRSDPGAHVFVGSIPNLYQLWSSQHNDWLTELVWRHFGICQSMLSQINTEAQRQQVVTREVSDNRVLAAVCATYANCRGDGGAVYRTAFTASEVSPVDHFHPDYSGQNHLAAVSWAASYWPSLR